VSGKTPLEDFKDFEIGGGERRFLVTKEKEKGGGWGLTRFYIEPGFFSYRKNTL